MIESNGWSSTVIGVDRFAVANRNGHQTAADEMLPTARAVGR